MLIDIEGRDDEDEYDDMELGVAGPCGEVDEPASGLLRDRSVPAQTRGPIVLVCI